MKNKGFSLVELIIVIAIMAVLAGALTPALIKYINKARLSQDINTGREIANAIMEAVTEDSAFDSAQQHLSPYPVDNMDDAAFKAAVYNILGVTRIEGKAKKDVDGNTIQNQVFYYTLDAKRNRVEIFYGDTTSDYMIYPVTGNKLIK